MPFFGWFIATANRFTLFVEGRSSEINVVDNYLTPSCEHNGYAGIDGGLVGVDEVRDVPCVGQFVPGDTK